MVNNHSRGAGCPKCAGVAHTSRAVRLLECAEIHGDRYDYSQWPVTVSAHTRVVTSCPDHGGWEHTVASHINHRSGCPACAKNQPRTFEQFIEQSRAAHGDRYEYRYCEKPANNTKVEIVCPDHGVFLQMVTNHLAGKGCAACAEAGLDMVAPAQLYILKAPGVFKIGVSGRLDQRMTQLRRGTPFEFDIHTVVDFPTGRQAYDAEQLLLRSFKSAELTGFDGATEWVLGSPDL